jgi:hypothetical protein
MRDEGDMGIFDHGLEFSRRPSHDGTLRCVLCSNTAPEADHEWCAAAECLICDDCCIGLLQGDPHRLVSIVAAVGRVVTPDALFRTCTGCSRAMRAAAEHVLEDDIGPAC